MLKIIKKTTPLKLDTASARNLQSQLQGRFNSLLAGVRLEYARRLGLDDIEDSLNFESETGEVELGEVFLTHPGTVCYVRYQNKEEALEACALSSDPSLDLEPFFTEISAGIESIGLVAKPWLEAPNDSAIPEDSELASANVSQKELEAAHELMIAENRLLLQRLSEQESILVRDLDTTGVQDLFQKLQHFEDLELIRKDYAVIDQKTGQQILRVPSRASLEEASQKFFIGGTAISNDNVDEVISLTPFCRHLLAGDNWLLLLLLGTLKKLNFGSNNIYICRSESAPCRVYVQASQQNFLLVLSNRRLSLDDAYLIGSQIAAYGIKDIIVISTDRTSTLMRHHLHQANPQAVFSFIDTLSELNDKLETILLERQRSHLREFLNPLAELTPVRVQDLIVKKMVPDSHRQHIHTNGESAGGHSQAEKIEESFEDIPDDELQEEADAGARRVADSFEAPAPDSLPNFKSVPHAERAVSPPVGIQIEMPQLIEENPLQQKEIFPAPELAVPDLPMIPETPHTEDESGQHLAVKSRSSDAGLGMELPNLPMAEELIPDLPPATL